MVFSASVPDVAANVKRLMRTMMTRGNRYRKILVKNILPMVRDYLREVESPSKLEENRPVRSTVVPPFFYIY